MAGIDFYRSRLKVNKHALDDEIEVQSQYQEEISRELSMANTRLLEAKDTLARTEARVYLDLKGDKVSDTAANNQVRVDSGRMADWRAWMAAREEHEQWLGMYDAWQRRGYSIKTGADLFTAQYFSVGTSVTGKRTREADVDIMRAAMRVPHRAREVRMSEDPPVVVRRRINGP